MEKKKNYKMRRVAAMFLGNFIIGMAVAFFRLSCFGTDSFTCMNLGVSGFVGMSFGNWQLIVNIVLLTVVFFTVRHLIGLGTVINMVFIGYIADFLCWLYTANFGEAEQLLLRILFLLCGSLCSPLGAALYMEANLGVSPYDSVAFVIRKFAKEKVSFRVARIASDVTIVLIGTAACLAAGNNVWQVVGLGTIITSVLNGPLIQFFRDRFAGYLGTGISVEF